jgi:hypothetical protein
MAEAAARVKVAPSRALRDHRRWPTTKRMAAIRRGQIR